jgi:hypothetical protein
LSSLTEFGAVARTYPVACSGVRQRNFDFYINEFLQVGCLAEIEPKTRRRLI